MKYLKIALLAFLLSCKSVFVAPTPFLVDNLTEKNDAAVTQYLACTEGANYVPEKEGCDPILLELRVEQAMGFAKEFISSDIKQPLGYDVYLSQAMVFFRIAERNNDAYSEAERIARQFFEVQKASASKSALTDARFYWAAIATAHASWQWLHDRLSLDADRKAELLLCYAEGTKAFHEIEAGPRKVRLTQYLAVLKTIIEGI